VLTPYKAQQRVLRDIFRFVPACMVRSSYMMQCLVWHKQSLRPCISSPTLQDCRSKHTQADLDQDGVDFATVDGFQVCRCMPAPLSAQAPPFQQEFHGPCSCAWASTAPFEPAL
jgi:hypothetical protein